MISKDAIVGKGAVVVLLAQLLWLGWPCAAPPPPLLGVLKPIAFGEGMICDFPVFLGRSCVAYCCVGDPVHVPCSCLWSYAGYPLTGLPNYCACKLVVLQGFLGMSGCAWFVVLTLLLSCTLCVLCSCCEVCVPCTVWMPVRKCCFGCAQVCENFLVLWLTQ